MASSRGNQKEPNFRPSLPWESYVPVEFPRGFEFESPSDFLIKSTNRRLWTFYDASLTALSETVCVLHRPFLHSAFFPLGTLDSLNLNFSSLSFETKSLLSID